MRVVAFIAEVPVLRCVLDHHHKEVDILKGDFVKIDVYVCGYTDSPGGDDLNLKPSLDPRAAPIVSDFLIARSVPKERLKV